VNPHPIITAKEFDHGVVALKTVSHNAGKIDKIDWPAEFQQQGHYSTYGWAKFNNTEQLPNHLIWRLTINQPDFQ